MSICLCHRSAERLLEQIAHAGKDSENSLEPVTGACINNFSSDDSEACDLLGDSLDEYKPLDVLVGHPCRRHSSEIVTAHLWTGRIPDGAIKKYSEGLYVVSPEFCLLQQARELHMVNLCQLLGQFLATASSVKKDDGLRVLEQRSPLTSVSRLEQFLSQMHRGYGTRLLREAMRYTLPGAASPQETNLQLVFSLPYAYYGYGFRGLELNHQVDLSGLSRDLCDGKHLYIDLFFGGSRDRRRRDADSLKSFGLEYQSEEFHQNPSRDASRFLAAHAQGIELWYVAYEQLNSAKAIDYIACEAARRTGRRIRPESWPTQAEVERLLDILNGRVIPRPGSFQRKRQSMARVAA